MGLAGPAGASGGGTVNVVAYSTPKAAFGAEVTAFGATAAGRGVNFSQSFAASGTQALDVVNGLPADVVNFSTTLDMQKLVTAGLVAKNWAANSTSGMVTDSIVSFIVRKGNPKHITTWADLVKSGVKVVTPNPFSSGSAKWNLMAGYGAELATGHSKAQAKAYLTALREAVVYVTQNHDQAAKWFADYLRTDPSLIEQVSADDPFYAADPAGIDISVKPSDRALIARWADDALANRVIKKKVDIDQLF